MQREGNISQPPIGIGYEAAGTSSTGSREKPDPWILPRPSWGYSGGMPKVSIYLPDELYAEAKRQSLPLSQVAQDAFEAALTEKRNTQWIASARARPVRTTSLTTEELMAAVDEEFGS